jgi:two-component system phosphate regulon sensor histidine kinase PhoR
MRTGSAHPGYSYQLPLLLAVITTSHRIFLYWLLLLAASLGVGAGAWLLLQREESRLLQRTESAEAARRAAVEARAALVAENVELLVGDVEAGLLDTLAEAPEEGLELFLNDWERSNPLVRTAFLATNSGQLLRPSPTNGDDEARGFRRRFAARLTEQPPWRAMVAEESEEKRMKEAFSMQEASDSRKKIEQNVINLNSARREVQALAKDRSSYALNLPPSVSSSAPTGREAQRGRSVPAEESDVADFAIQERAAPAAKAVTLSGAKRGWLPWAAEGRLHLLGWVWPSGAADVRGVEVELAALVSRLGGSMPAEVSGGEGYALRDDKGRVQHQAGVVPAADGETPTVRVPLSSDLLPGWEVVAFLAPTAAENGAGSFFWIGAMLAAVLVLAILTSGSLLLWQARRSEAEAAQKTSFVANVSHEFKTPLTTIRLYSELLEQGRVADAGKQNDYLRTIGRETQRLARLVNNALDFSRLEQGKKKFQRESCDLGAELARLLDTHEPRIAEAGLALTRELPAAPLTLSTDRDAVEQIVLNLIDNACKYAAEGGELMVTLSAGAGGGAELRVSDRGHGVPDTEREQIFEKFHRVDETLTAEKSGTGLGLSIARQLARGLGGELRCDARPGGGAVFVLTLP